MFRFTRFLVFMLVAGVCLVKLDEQATAADVMLQKGMEWTGEFARETLKKNAPYIASHSKTRSAAVSPFRLRITEVNGSSVVGEFHWTGTDHEAKGVKFKGVIAKNGQFQFPITEVIKGAQNPSILQTTITGSLEPDGETIRGSLMSTGRKLSAFEGHLKEKKTKRDRRASK